MMRILLDQSSHDMRNKGNNALLEVAASRFKKFWPEAAFDIITLAPQITRLYYPWSKPVAPPNLSPYANRMGNIFKWIPKSLLWLVFEIREEQLHRRMKTTREAGDAPSVASSKGVQDQPKAEIIDKRFSVTNDHEDNQKLLENIASYDLVVACGGGYFCDSDKPRLLKVFDRLEAAAQQNIPAVMVGQGVGPLEDCQLRDRAAQVLPKLGLVCVRERRVALPIMENLGMPDEKIRMTGDDAIELAYQARSKSPGRGIGLSVRISSYTQIYTNHMIDIRTILHAFANKHNAPLIAVPISSAPHESDIAHIRTLMDGYPLQNIAWRKLDTPLDSIRLAGRCRIMLAGTYHGAVFSLAQGIPVIGLARSDEYFYKLSGLTDEFGPGCHVLKMDDHDLSSKLSSAFENLWNAADELKPELLRAAERQVRWSHEAYDQIFKMVSKRHG